jgi:hypothetical protein
MAHLIQPLMTNPPWTTRIIATLTTRTDNVSGKSQAFPGGSQGSAAHLSLSFSVDFGMFDPLPPTSKINHFGLRPV